MDAASLHSLTVLLRQRERERDQARGISMRAIAQHGAAKAQLDQLHGYRLDYERRWALQFRQPNGIDVLQAYHAFCGRLTQAIEQQMRLLEQRTQQRDTATAALRTLESGVAAVERLIASRRHDARRAEERAEQKETDEFASHRRERPLTADDPVVGGGADHDQLQEAAT